MGKGQKLIGALHNRSRLLANIFALEMKTKPRKILLQVRYFCLRKHSLVVLSDLVKTVSSCSISSCRVYSSILKNTPRDRNVETLCYSCFFSLTSKKDHVITILKGTLR